LRAPMIKGTFYLDHYGYPRATYQPPQEVLGEYLEQDVQSSSLACDSLLHFCNEVADGRRDSWQASGNAHTVTISSGRVRIENEFSDSGLPCELPIEDFMAALLSWKEFISSIPK
jgi:uncharacterized protein YacL (UPF0231 family)